MTPTPPPAPVDLDGLIADLDAANIQVLPMGNYVILDTPQGWTIDVYADGDVFVDGTRFQSETWTALSIIRRHTQPTEGA